MTSSAFRRVKVYKRFLVRRMKAMKESAFKVKLTHLTAKELGERAREFAPGVSFTNVARDVRLLTSAGENYDAEFDLLWRGQVIPQIVSDYSETYLADLMKGVLSPSEMDARLREVRTRPDGKPVWEDV